MTRSARLALVALAATTLTGLPSLCGESLTPSAAFAQQGKKVDLRPKFTKGQEIRLKLELVNRAKTTSATTTAPKTPPKTKPADDDDATQDQNKDQDISQEYTLLLKVKDTNAETGSTLELVYEQVKLKMKSPSGDMDFDSTKPKKDDPVDELLRPMVGTKLTVEMDAKGNIKNVSGGDPLQDAAGGLGGAMTGPSALKDFFGRVFSSGPGNSGFASVGETWSSDDKMEAPGGTWNITTTNTLKSAVGGKADIDIKGKLTFSPSTSGQGAPVKVQNASYGGKATWNTERGMLDSMETRQHVESLDTKSNQRTINEATMKVTRLK